MHILDYIFLLRPTILIPVWIFLLLGYYRAGGGMFRVTPSFTLGFLIYTMIMGAVYIVNQITDIETDRINNKLFILPKGLVSVRAAYVEIVCLIGGAFALSFFFSPVYRIFLILSFALGLLYSVRPAKFKGRPFLDLLSNAFGYGFLGFSVGWLFVKDLSIDTLVYSIPYILAVGGVFVNTTIPDIKGDRESDEITTGVYLGERKALLLALILVIGSLVSSIVLLDFICLPCAAIASLIFLWVYRMKSKTRETPLSGEKISPSIEEEKIILLSVRLSAPLLALAVCIIYPWFLALLLLVFLFSRFYYKKRFNLVYPSI